MTKNEKDTSVKRKRLSSYDQTRMISRADKMLILTYLGAMFGIMILGSWIRPVDAITFDKIVLHYKNDFRACYSGSEAYSFSISDDGLCRQLFSANEELGIGDCYYQSYTQDENKKLAFISRCDCEYVTNQKGIRAYNRSCFSFNIHPDGCIDLSGKKKEMVFSTYFNDSTWIRYVSTETSG
jgi:hypothetical protein